MKTNSCSNKSPSEIASELFQGTKVESAFDKTGKFSHLLAKLSKNEFTKLYSPNTTVTIFIQGYWLQLCLNSKNKKILNRETNTYLNLEIYTNNFGITILEMYYLGKKVGKFQIKKLNSDDLAYSPEGYYILARTAVKVFSKIQSSYTMQKVPMHYFPVVQIIPEDNETSFFDRNLVNIQ
ncbi:hypothetical protein [Silvanigrella aquatica]|uniref:Uncharacterized protein n=1 Tax=Silvanigrella aquatica TaxID=1915309 RepID=A0A1L4CZN1_9BACT|nr:hypothetical protein [Silvanigrella aquatica]APJ03414.1 hypothetical protein AXG55_05635 [Silvanigrella aquatica]